MRDEKRFKKTLSSGVAALALVALGPTAALGGPTPAEKCLVAKSKAAAKKIGAKLKCYQKAIQGDGEVDPTCLTAAETKFTQAIARAEAPGGCTFTGDGGTIEQAADSCVTQVVALTPASTTTTTLPSGPQCCIGANFCTWLTSAACVSLQGVPGGAGTVCDSATGGCISPPAGAGPCCSVASGTACFAGPAMTSGCAGLAGVLTTGVCPSAGPCS